MTGAIEQPGFLFTVLMFVLMIGPLVAPRIAVARPVYGRGLDWSRHRRMDLPIHALYEAGGGHRLVHRERSC